MSRIGFLSPDGCDSPRDNEVDLVARQFASGKSSIAAEIRSRLGGMIGSSILGAAAVPLRSRMEDL